MSPPVREHDERALRQRAKLALRKRMRSVRSMLPDTACDERSARIAARVLELDGLGDASTVLAFASIRNEVRTAGLINALHDARKRVALPRVEGDRLALHAVDRDTPLSEGAYEVPEPPEDAPSIDPGEVDFALVPALAVDDRGYRIGYGGGYYDRLLPELSAARTCVIAYDFQLVAEVPNADFDVAVDIVATDARLIVTR